MYLSMSVTNLNLMKKKSKLKVDPTLNQYENVVRFPEKLERARNILREHPIPQHLLER